MIGWKDGENKLLVDPEEIKCLTVVSTLKDEADNIYELYAEPNVLYEEGSVWKDIILSPSRASPQLDLRTSIHRIENARK